jgi:hypothetical protein
MSTNRIEYWSRNYRPQLWTLVVVNALLGIQLLLAALYGAFFGTSLLSLHVFLIPFVWTTVSVVTVWHTDSVSRGWRPTAVAGAAAVGYLTLFLWLSGTVGFTPSQVEPITGEFGFGIEVGRSLGWGPVIYYSGEWVGARIIPYQLIGYGALSYLVYATILDATRSASAGTLGLILCPGCAAAALVPLFGGIAGLSAALSFFIQYSYEIATLMFVAAMGWLHYQPSILTLRRYFSTNLLPITGSIAVLVGALHFFHPTHGFLSRSRCLDCCSSLALASLQCGFTERHSTSSALGWHSRFSLVTARGTLFSVMAPSGPALSRRDTLTAEVSRRSVHTCSPTATHC